MAVRKTAHVTEVPAPRSARIITCANHKPTVCLGVTYAVVCTYGCDDGRIAPPRCAIIDAGLDGRCSPRPACRTPPAGARSARSVLGAASRPASTAAPGAFPRSKTILPSVTTPCGDANRARCAPCAVKARYRNVETPSDIQVSDEPLELSSPGHLGG